MLEIKNLSMVYESGKAQVPALRDINLFVQQGDIVGLVGESGSGKSTLLLAVMGLLAPAAKIESGEILYRDTDLLKEPPAEMRDRRGRSIAMVFQDPMTALNPVFPVGEQIREALRVHNFIDKTKLPKGVTSVKTAEKNWVLDLMQEVEIPSPETRYNEYPHQFSGGMQQRALIAMALSCRPRLLLADEPTTALDATVQAQIMDLLVRINRRREMAMILVTHDLALASEFCHRLVIMYAGQIMEEGPTAAVVAKPLHPYTQALLRSLPKLHSKERIEPIAGAVPDLSALPPGCSFAPRCPYKTDACDLPVEMRITEEGRRARCILV